MYCKTKWSKNGCLTQYLAVMRQVTHFCPCKRCRNSCCVCDGILQNNQTGFRPESNTSNTLFPGFLSHVCPSELMCEALRHIVQSRIGKENIRYPYMLVLSFLSPFIFHFSLFMWMITKKGFATKFTPTGMHLHRSFISPREKCSFFPRPQIKLFSPKPKLLFCMIQFVYCRMYSNIDREFRNSAPKFLISK